MIQNWHRDEGPCIALGTEGAFDDMHLFSPCVAYGDGVYSMYYSDRATLSATAWTIAPSP